MQLYEDHETIVTALAFSPDGSLLASGARDGWVVVRDSSGVSTLLRAPSAKNFSVHSLAFLSDRMLLRGHVAGWEMLRETTSGWESSELATSALAGVAVLDVDRVALGDATMFRLHDLKTNRTIQPTFREPYGVRAVATCPAQKLVAWSTGGRVLNVWDVRKQTPLTFRTSHTCTALALAPDGSALAAVQDWAVRVIDLGLKQDRAVLKGHKGIVSCVAFSPDGATIATGSWDQTVRLWEVASGRERAVFQWPVGKVFSLAYAPDGLRLAVGGDKGAVLVWDVE